MYNLTDSHHHYNAGVDVIVTDDFQLSDADRKSYEKVFSSILVPYTALTIGEEIGQGACVCEGERV